jgi:hypothetical protein
VARVYTHRLHHLTLRKSFDGDDEEFDYRCKSIERRDSESIAISKCCRCLSASIEIETLMSNGED